MILANLTQPGSEDLDATISTLYRVFCSRREMAHQNSIVDDDGPQPKWTEVLEFHPELLMKSDEVTWAVLVCNEGKPEVLHSLHLDGEGAKQAAGAIITSCVPGLYRLVEQDFTDYI